jgi:hypothetical protein
MERIIPYIMEHKTCLKPPITNDFCHGLDVIKKKTCGIASSTHKNGQLGDGFSLWSGLPHEFSSVSISFYKVVPHSWLTWRT